MTSVPSVADMGFSGMPMRNSTSADQPVAMTIGASGTSARLASRSTTSSTSATASSPATSVRKRCVVDDSEALAAAARTGSPASAAVVPAGGCSRERMYWMTCSWRESGISRIPNASVASRRSGVITACEK